MKVTTVRLPESLYADLEAEAEERDLSVSEYIRDVLRDRENTQANTEANTQANTTRLDELEARLEALEDRLDAEASHGGAERVESETTHTLSDTDAEGAEPGAQPDSAPTRDAGDDARQLVEAVAEREGWDDDGRLEARKAAAAAAVRALRERGELGKSDAVDDLGLFDEYPVAGQDAETWWRRNCRPVLGEIGDYSRGLHAYVLDED